MFLITPRKQTNFGSVIKSTRYPEALNLLGFIEDQGLLGEPNVTKAVDYYVAAIEKIF